MARAPASSSGAGWRTTTTPCVQSASRTSAPVSWSPAPAADSPSITAAPKPGGDVTETGAARIGRQYRRRPNGDRLRALGGEGAHLGRLARRVVVGGDAVGQDGRPLDVAGPQ